jgi:hypothetical protein
MIVSFVQVITYDGEGLKPEVTVEDAGWSKTLKPVLGFSTSRSLRRASCPAPVKIALTGEMIENVGALKAVKVRLPLPTFDLGLGCFGCPSKLINTGRGEHDGLWLADALQLEVAQKLFEGKMTWSDDEWVDFQLQAWLEEESTNSSTSHSDVSTSTYAASSTPSRTFGCKELLEELDDLEAARSDPGEQENSTSREGAWRSGSQISRQSPPEAFDNWIDAIAALEESVSMPAGTRYY